MDSMVSHTPHHRAAAQAEVLAIIPARGGSKSIPRKNVKLLGGVPLIGYSIAAGQQARTVTRLIVSTDDEEIARLAESYSVEVPFMRPAELAEDDTTDLPVFQHALGWLEKFEGYRPDIVVQLRPTTPLRPPHCVDQAVRALLENPAADAVRAVVPSEQNPYKMWRVAADGLMQPLLTNGIPEPYNEPRQKLPQTYWQTGHVDAARYDTIMHKGSMTGDTICPLILDPSYTVDIDTPLDWERAEWVLARGTLDIVQPPDFAPQRRPSGPLAHPHERREGHFGRPDAAGRWQSAEARGLLGKVRLLVLDFDGVMTDNRVLVRQDGQESVWCSRADGLGLQRLREWGLEAVILSTETNPCVTARARKLGLACVQGCDAKLDALQAMARERSLEAHEVAYVGNDLNDLDCLRWVGLPIAVADAEAEVLTAARLVTTRYGGRGAVREVADALIAHAAAQAPPADVGGATNVVAAANGAAANGASCEPINSAGAQ
jgi:YrbI family 3-deoxy-D-manno-octulosonate 8-phosphate phosphatase